MSEFYGWLQGSRGETHRGGTRQSGIWAKVQSWKNHVKVEMRRDGDIDKIHITVKAGADAMVFVNGEPHPEFNER